MVWVCHGREEGSDIISKFVKSPRLEGKVPSSKLKLMSLRMQCVTLLLRLVSAANNP